jgi:hypothetical protein
MIDCDNNSALSRRLFLAAGPAGAVFASLSAAVAAETFGPLFARLVQGPPAPTTWAGMMAGLEFLDRERLAEAEAAPVFGVCLDYLRACPARA